MNNIIESSWPCIARKLSTIAKGSILEDVARVWSIFKRRNYLFFLQTSVKKKKKNL